MGLKDLFWESGDGKVAPVAQVTPAEAAPLYVDTNQVSTTFNPDINFEEVIWNGAIAPDSPLDKFFKISDSLQEGIPNETIRNTTALSVLASTAGIGKDTVISAITTAVQELQTDKVNSYEPELDGLKNSLIGPATEELQKMTENIEADTAVIREAEERIHQYKLNKINLEADIEAGTKTHKLKVDEFTEKWNKIISKLNSLKVKLG